jgi:hypothetical protein
VPKRTQEIFWEKSDFSNRAQGAQEIFGKNRISFEMEWSGNFRFRVLVVVIELVSSKAEALDSM